jgi:hypothetical protein
MIIPVNVATEFGKAVDAEWDESRDELRIGNVKVDVSLLRYSQLNPVDRSLPLSEHGMYEGVLSNFADGTYFVVENKKRIASGYATARAAAIARMHLKQDAAAIARMHVKQEKKRKLQDDDDMMACPTSTGLESEEDVGKLLLQIASNQFEKDLLVRRINHVVERHMDPGLRIGALGLIKKVYNVLKEVMQEYKRDNKRADLSKTKEFTKNFVQSARIWRFAN